MKHIRIFLVILLYGQYSEESFRCFTIHFEGKSKEQWNEWVGSDEYKVFSKVMKWPQLKRIYLVLRLILFFCFAIMIGFILNEICK